MEHLEPGVREVLEQPRAARIAFANSDHWVGYAQAARILSRLDDLIAFPRSLRMPNILIVGRSGNGKSSILDRFVRRHPIQVTETGSPLAPILRVDMPDTPDETEFWSTILWALGISHREKDPAAVKKRQAKATMTYANVRILVIDEFNNLTNAGKGAVDLLSAIKELSNQLRVSIVAAGTQAAINALNSDPQMKSRFEPAGLERWTLDAEYLRLLVSYERLLPLPAPSGLGSRALAPVIYRMGGETIGGTIKLLKAATARAIDSGAECITPSLLGELDWTPPGDWDAVGRRV
jgi:hypothetical protein